MCQKCCTTNKTLVSSLESQVMIGGGIDNSSSSSFNSDNNHDDSLNSLLDPSTVIESTDPPTKGMSKSARNRYYAQTSRARHRQYVANLEKDREMLLERLEKIEEENRRMREEILEMRITKRVRTEAEDAELKSTSSNISPLNSKSNIYTAAYDFKTTNPFFNPSSTSTFDSNYALSVLDFILFPRFKQQHMQRKQLASSIDSPRPVNPQKFQAPHFLLVNPNEVKRKEPMNWRDNCYLKEKKKKRKMRERNRLNLIRLVKLAKLKIYLQQFGNSNL